VTISNAFDILKQRGFVKQATSEAAVKEAFEKGQVTVYIGFDPTADSLHVGNLICLMALANLQRAGHRIIAVIGDGTTMIGDPSGKTELRKMLSREQILVNAAKIKTQISQYVTFDEKNGLAVHNSDWLLKLNHVDFLREIGACFSVNRMLSAEAYRSRMETGLSFLEFNYQILQAYDFLQLYRNYGCTVQLGGDDQWGNILAGVDLVRRKESAAAEGVTWPLLTTASGAKMGKTANGAVWLDPDKTSPYEFYQYWINCHDRDAGRFLAFFTFLPMDEVGQLADLEGADIRQAKEILAFEATTIVHGEEEARKAQLAARSAFGGAEKGVDNIPHSTIALEVLKNGMFASDLFAEAGLAKSKGEARRLIKQGGAYLNDEKISDTEQKIFDDLLVDGAMVLRAGKKRYHRVICKE